MNRKSRIWSTFVAVVCALAVVLLFAVPGAGATGSKYTGKTKPERTSVSLPCTTLSYRPGEVIVKFKNGVVDKIKDEVKSLAGAATSLGTFGPKGSNQTQLLMLDAGVQVEQAVARLKSSDKVAYAEPNYIARASYTPDDPNLGNQWGLNNTGQTINGVAGTPDADIDAPEAWDIDRGLDVPATVAVIDTGIDSSHPDLDSKVLTGYNWAGISQSSITDGWTFGYNAGSQSVAQSIKGTGQGLNHIGLLLAKVGSPSSGITVSVRSSLGGSDLASYSISPSEVSSGGDEVYKALSFSVTLSSGTTYYLVFRTSNSSTSDYYGIYDNVGSHNYNTYSDGQEYWFNGSSWVGYSDDDFFFQTNPNANPRDDFGHGTHVSGIIAAETNNATGIAGVCPGAKIMPLKALNSAGSGYDSDINLAIYYAADHGAKIINMSLGSSSFSQSQQDAINYAYNKGVVVLASSGNTGDTTMNYPAGCSNVIGVGATTNQDQIASFSTYNSSVDVSAPGLDIYSTMPTYPVGMNNLGYTQNYSYMSGTSMACPMAAGLGALVVSRSPSQTPQQVQQLLENYANDLGSAGRDDYFGYGRINAFSTINNVAATPHITSITPSSSAVNSWVHITGTGFGTGGASSYVTFFNAQNATTANWTTTGIDALVPAGAQTGNVTVTTQGGTSNAQTFTVNHAPTIASVTPSSGFNNDSSLTVAVTGDYFQNPPTSIKLTGPATITGTAITYTDAQHVGCTFNLSGKTTGAYDIEVTNPDTGVGTKTNAFRVENPVPNISSLSPEAKTAGDDAFTLTVNGSNFVAGSKVKWNGADRTTHFDSATKLTADIPASDIASAGTASVTVFHPSPGGGTSNAKTLTINAEPKPPPPPPRRSPSSTWYLAEGSTNYGFDTYITIQNPNTSKVTAQITYMTGTGNVSGGTITLPAKSQTTLNPRDKLGNQDFSTKVVCKEGKTIAVDRTMSWTGPGAASPEAHSSIGVTSPTKTWYLPEGSSSWGFECYLLIQNPNARVASCTVTYMIEGEGPLSVTKSVPANSRKSFNIADDIGEKDASIKVEGNIPVIPERAMYRNNRREGHDSIGTISPATEFYLAEGTSAYGFTTYVLIQNPNSNATDVTVTYMTPTGPKTQEPFSMEPNSRKTIRVNDVLPNTDFSTQVHGTKPIIAERSMYWDKGTGEACHDSVGMASAHSSFYLPDGQTSEGRETYTLVQNPNSSAVTVEISYLTPTGEGNVVFTETIGANSRKSYSMSDRLPNGRAAIMVISKTAGKKIMVERAMYWNSRGAGTDTIGGCSD